MMAETPVFGSPESHVRYTARRAAYAVIFDGDGKVATVRSGRKSFLPGGGALAGERPEETIAREVREELARGVRLLREIGEATQYFYSDTDDRHYEMRAVFFAGEFTEEACGTEACEHELEWLHVAEAEQSFFHACHAWAVSRYVVQRDTEG